MTCWNHFQTPRQYNRKEITQRQGTSARGNIQQTGSDPLRRCYHWRTISDTPKYGPESAPTPSFLLLPCCRLLPPSPPLHNISTSSSTLPYPSILASGPEARPAVTTACVELPPPVDHSNMDRFRSVRHCQGNPHHLELVKPLPLRTQTRELGIPNDLRELDSPARPEIRPDYRSSRSCEMWHTIPPWPISS